MQLSEKNTTYDCISRQAAIDALDGNVIVTSRKSAQAVMDYIRGCADKIRSLPSAQPEIIRCGECTHKDKEIDYCHYLGITICERDYCSYGKRRTDETD